MNQTSKGSRAGDLVVIEDPDTSEIENGIKGMFSFPRFEQYIPQVCADEATFDGDLLEIIQIMEVASNPTKIVLGQKISGPKAQASKSLTAFLRLALLAAMVSAAIAIPRSDAVMLWSFVRDLIHRLVSLV